MAVSDAEISRRFEFHPPSQKKTEYHESVRTILKGTALAVNRLPGESREKSTALTLLQEAMWAANAHIAIHLDEEGNPRER